MKKIAALVLFLFCISRSLCQDYTSASFYLVAHQDQWQLFMGIDAYNDIAVGPPGKVIFIYTTAGDESCRGAALDTSYYLARQEGANNSVEFCADKSTTLGGMGSLWDTTYVTISDHSILKYTYKNVVSYCLRLPDGCFGSGLFGQSLQYLHNHPATHINAVDGSAVYSGWNDLVNTVQQIINNERAGIPDVWLKTADTDTAYNPGDHPDHIYTALLGLDAIAPLYYINEALYQEYNTSGLPVNLSNADIATESALLSILDYGRTSNSRSSEWSSLKVSFTSRNYFRVIAGRQPPIPNTILVEY